MGTIIGEREVERAAGAIAEALDRLGDDVSYAPAAIKAIATAVDGGCKAIAGGLDGIRDALVYLADRIAERPP